MANKSGKIDAIIFDCFGVLVNGTTDHFYAKYMANEPAKISQVKTLSQNSDRGVIEYNAFVQGAADLAGISFNDANRVFLDAPKNEALFHFIRDDLRPSGYKIGLLSNLGSGRALQVMLKSDLALFDTKTLSYQVKMAKPDAEIYRLAARQLGTIEQRCVFIDDNVKNVTGAQRVGMIGILYQDFASLRQELDILLARE